jgi:hypothetical protein
MIDDVREDEPELTEELRIEAIDSANANARSFSA